MRGPSFFLFAISSYSDFSSSLIINDSKKSALNEKSTVDELVFPWNLVVNSVYSVGERIDMITAIARNKFTKL